MMHSVPSRREKAPLYESILIFDEVKVLVGIIYVNHVQKYDSKYLFIGCMELQKQSNHWAG